MVLLFLDWQQSELHLIVNFGMQNVQKNPIIVLDNNLCLSFNTFTVRCLRNDYSVQVKQRSKLQTNSSANTCDNYEKTSFPPSAFQPIYVTEWLFCYNIFIIISSAYKLAANIVIIITTIITSYKFHFRPTVFHDLDGMAWRWCLDMKRAE